MKKCTRLLSLLLAFALLAVLCACGTPEDISASVQSAAISTEVETAPTQNPSGAATEASTDIADTQEPISDTAEGDLPLVEETQELTVWTAFMQDLSSLVTSMGDLPAYQYAETLTNVHLVFSDVAAESAQEQFNLMINSGDYRDLMISGITNYTGGAAKAVDDGVFLILNDLVEEYAPDYLAVVNSTPGNQKDAYTDQGDMVGFYAYFDRMASMTGPLIRKDWLDELGLEPPETYDEWEDVLAAFKSAHTVTDTLLLPSSVNNWAGGYGTIGFNCSVDFGNSSTHFYQTDGVVHSSLTEEGFRTYIEKLRKWFDAGYIAKDFYAKGANAFDSAVASIILNGQCGIWNADISDAENMKASSAVDGFDYMPIGFPVEHKGDTTGFGNNMELAQGGDLAISAQCENPELAVRWMNFWYTPTGSMIANYGEEGVTYEMVDGQPKYTDLITDNPDMPQMLATNYYTLLQLPSTKILDTCIHKGFTDAQFEAMELWEKTADGSSLIPTKLSMTTEEGEEYSNTVSDINTYASEKIIKFIIGDEPMEQWDSFVETVESMDLDRCVEIYQAALDRYMAR